MIRLITALFLMLVWAQPAHADLSQHQERKMIINDVERTYQIHQPVPMPVNLKNGLPLVIVLHGGRSTGEQIARASRFSAKADKNGFIVVYPDGTGKNAERRLTWNAGDCCDVAMTDNAEDVLFISSLIDNMVKFQGADPKRVYIAGMSNGGMLAHRLGAELATKVTAIGVVEGGMFASQPIPSVPVSTMIIHGQIDKTVPFEGGETRSSLMKPYVKPDTKFLPTQSAYNFWREKNGCAADEDASTKGRITTYTSKVCKNQTVVALQVIKNGAHNWPGSSKAVYSEFDDGSSYLGHDATDALWEFFSQQRKHP